MKKIFVLLVAVATMFTQSVFAQDKAPLTDAQRAEHKAQREQLMQIRLELLKAELTLSEEQWVKFEQVYRKYRSDVQRITSVNRDARIKKDNITNENALKVVSARLSNQILTATLKQNYLLAFAEVMEPLQVMKLYRVDEKISREAQKILKYRQTASAAETKK